MLPLKSPRNRRRLEPTDADMVPESEDSMSEAEQSEESMDVDSDEEADNLAVDVMLNVDELDVDESEADTPRLLGETLPLFFDDPESQDVGDTIPNRLLTDFVIFDEQTGLNVLLEDLEEDRLEHLPIARGLVSPMYEYITDPEDEANVEEDSLADEDELEDNDDPRNTVLVNVTSIFRVWTNQGLDIWLQTAFAWYKVDVPSKDYRAAYENYFIRQALVCALSEIISVGAPPEAQSIDTVERFISTLAISDDMVSDLPFDVQRIIGRTLTADDFKKHRQWVVGQVDYLSQHPDYYDFHINPANRLWKSLKGNRKKRQFGHRKKPHSLNVPDTSSARLSLSRPSHTRTDVALLRQFIRPILPRIVNRNASAMFDLVRMSGARSSMSVERRSATADLVDADVDIDDGPENVFGFLGPERASVPPPISGVMSEANQNDKVRLRMSARSRAVLDRDVRRWVEVGGTRYKAGDYALIDPKLLGPRYMWNKPSDLQATHSVNALGNTHRFGHILEILVEMRHTEGLPGKRQCAVAHVQWLDHASKRLEEAHHPRELFLLPSCEQLDAQCLKDKLNVHVIQNNAPRDVPLFTYNAPDRDFFLRFMWDDNDSSIKSLPPLVLQSDHVFSCYSCEMEASKNNSSVVRRDIEGTGAAVLRFQNNSYHVGDFVYIARPTIDAPDLFRVGQIRSLDEGVTIIVRKFKRCKDSQISERHISPKASNSKIKATRLGGKCYVIATSAWTSRPDVADGTIFGKISHMYHSDAFDAVSHPPLRSGQAQLDPDVVPSCPLCHDTISDHLSRLAQEPLALMDIFCGAGGMSQGFTRTGVATPICGVDISRSCCETFQSSHPDATVVCDDINHLLSALAGGATENIKIIHGGEPKRFPSKGEVDIISLTPPCTGYSGLNRFKSAMDLRNTYIVSGLAFIETLEPTFVVIENVLNMARFPLKARDAENGALIGGISWGTHKFILRTLMDLGYQVRYALLNASNYGTPQSRSRLVYLAALAGYSLPDIPQPTHHSISPQTKPVKTSWGTIPTPEYQPYYPHRHVSVRDAIHDLPPFDWHSERLEPGPWNAVERPTRGGRYGLPDPECRMYHTPCSSDYQRWIRARCEELTHHFTVIYSKVMTERVTQIPQDPLANHHALPTEFEAGNIVGTTGAAARQRLYPKCYARIKEDGLFPTIVTRINPEHRQGEVLHPQQRRVLTVRECARAQGFSDTTDFHSTTGTELDRYRQIGNAIPVPLSMALARSIASAAFRHMA